MKKAMKKITYLLIAAMSLVTVASCVKELTPEPLPAVGSDQEFTVALPAATRTALVEGKTVWAKGDSLWVSNGSASEAIVVPKEAWGQKEFTFVAKNVYITEENPKLYVVYPYTAAAGVTEGKIKVTIPSAQDGEFATANIAAAIAEAYTIALKNVTAVMKITIPEDTEAPIYSLAFSTANGNPLTGVCAVDFSGATPAVTPLSASNGATIQVDALAKDFYLSVIPGTFDAGFTVTAATTDFQHAAETKATTVSNTLSVNDLVDLGAIGRNLQSLNGEGTEANPWLIESLGHLIAIGSAVDEGKDFKDMYFKVATDIDGVSTPIGSDTHPFCGGFDGNGKTIALNMTGSSSNLGLFSAISNGAKISNLILAGAVSSTGENVGALVGTIVAAKDLPVAEVQGVVNRATVKGSKAVGGIAGYSNYASIIGCSNEGSVEGGTRVGGISGFAYVSEITNCTNKSNVTGTSDAGGFFYMTYNSGGKLTYGNRGSGINGTGGIAGAVQNSTLKGCSNEGLVSGLNKVGGVLGTLFWSHMDECSNSGAVTATSATSLVGGLLGYSHCAYDLTKSTNMGSVNGVSVVGGIVGYATGTYYGHSSAMSFKISGCTNKGKITASEGIVGGICGVQVNSQNPSQASVYDCVNEGEIYTEGYKAGGITAVMACCTGWSEFQINRCVNNGTVSAKKWVGGITAYLASAQDYWKPDLAQTLGNAKNKWNIYNCINNGTILGYGSETDDGEFVGGIVGYNFSTAGAEKSNLGLFISNCLNTGSVLYRDNAHKKVYCGGIVGNYLRGRIYNICNIGRVGPESGTPAEGSGICMGALIGNYNDNDTRYLALQEAYYLQGTCEQAMGTSSKTEANTDNILNIASFDADGQLSDEVTYNGASYMDCVEALNAWVTKNGVWDPEKGSGFYPWIKGPAFDN